jgi:tetratricopeptide (TPR) repeat protein
VIDLPFDVSYRFDADLRDVPNSPDGMVMAVAYLAEQLGQVAQTPQVEARMLGRMAVFCRMLGRLEEAEGYAGRALALCKEAGDDSCELANSIRLAHVLQWQGRFEEADALFLDTLARSHEPSLSRYRSFAHQHYGKSLYDQRRYHEAAEHFQAALDLRDQRARAFASIEN